MANTLSEHAANEVKRLAEKAAPHRINITDTLGKKMTYLRQSFVLHFVKDINKKKDKEHYVEVKVAQEKIFRKIKDYIYYSGKSSSNPQYDGLNKLAKLLDEVNVAVQYLRYTGLNENLEELLTERGMTISCRALENTDAVLLDPDVKENIINVFNSAEKVQGEICAESETIKINIFNELDDGIKYDSKHNKSGIRSNEFDKLTALEATKQKSEELAEKKLETLKDSIGATIDSKLNVQTVAQTIAG